MAAPAAPSRLCGIPECTRPCHDGGTVVHDFCGRTHAEEAVSRGIRPSLRRPHGSCHECKLDGCSLPVYFDSAKKRVHDFCSRSHADKAIADGQWTRFTSAGKTNAGGSTCKLPGCHFGVFIDPVTSLESDYCSKSHRAQANTRECLRKGCASTAWLANIEGPQYCSSRCAIDDGGQKAGSSRSCKLAGCSELALYHHQTGNALDYCGEDHRVHNDQQTLGTNGDAYVERIFHGGTTGTTDFKLCVLSKANPYYPSLTDQFANKWVKPEPVGGVSVEKIFTVEVPADVRRKTKSYEKTVGNVRRRFHGTSCSTKCNFFVDLKGNPCSDKDCNVCSICTHGFTLQGNVGGTARRTKLSLRYGEGLYFSSVSGKANDYADLSEKTDSNGRRLRCMFVANVAAGKAFKTHRTSLQQNECPPAGYDSVVGEVGQGLNYDELVVYKDEAALPTHLIVYSRH
ncbi:unnamed protein product [Ectocarpus sp. 13 AM-2016]